MHTPGPWEANCQGCETFGNPEWIKRLVAIAVPRKTLGDAVSDARLISAAPDLLAACEAIAGMKLSPQTKHAELLALCMAIAKTAVDKAEGKS